MLRESEYMIALNDTRVQHAFGIDNVGRGILCLVDETKEKAECQDFLVPDASISDDVISLMSFPK